MEIDRDEFVVHDLKTVFSPSERYSIASCLEVAEHLEEEYADTIIDSLVSASDIVVFSAAIPFQRGVHHVNCQWQSYWVNKFNERGYQELDCIRKKVWNEKKVQHFYAQNMFMFVKKDEKYHSLLELGKYNISDMYDLVHPRMWESLCEAKFMKIVYSLYYRHHWVYDLYNKIFNRK